MDVVASCDSTHSYRALTLCEPAQAGASNDRRAAAGNEPRQRPTEAGATQLSHLHRTPLGSSRSVMSSTRAIISKRGTLTTLGRPAPNPEEVGCSMAVALRSGCVDAFDEMQLRGTFGFYRNRNPCLLCVQPLATALAIDRAEHQRTCALRALHTGLLAGAWLCE